LLLNKHFQKFRNFAFMLIIAMLLTTLSPLSVFAEEAEEKEYAETIVSANTKTHNAKHYDDGLVEVEKDGRKGLITNQAANKQFIYIDVADDFMYDLPDGTPVNVTVTYYDDVKSRTFCLMYDSHHRTPKFTNATVDYWGATDFVTCEGTKEWKTHTFHLTDLRAINRINYGADIRAQTWMVGTSEARGDVIFGGIRVEYGEYDSYLELTNATSKYVGNTFSIDDENIKMNFEMTNRAKNDGVTGKVSYQVLDSNKNILYESSFEEELADGEKKSVPVNFKNLGKNGLYTIEYQIDSSYKSKPEKSTHHKGELWFSIMNDFKMGEMGNIHWGVCQQIGMKERGDRESVAELVQRVGGTYLRDDRPRTTYKDGKWYVLDEYKEMYKMLKEHGIEPVLIIDVPSEGRTWPAPNLTWMTNNPPDTEEDIKAYAQYCYDVVSDLKGLVQYFEIFNEYNINVREGVPSASAENYAKMSHAAREAMKQANPDCTVIGIASAGSTNGGVDRGTDYIFTKGVFEAGGFDALDAVSVHPYDWRRSFDIDRFMDNAEELHGLISEYGDKDVWITEYGWGTAYPGTNQSYTQEQQYQHTLLQTTIARSYGYYSPMLTYCLLDMTNREEQEHNWGFLHEWTRTDGNSYTAKKVYVAMAAYNKFLGTGTEHKKNIEKDNSFIFHYYNNTMEKDILFMSTGGNERAVTLDLGVNSVELYDVFGNKMCDLSSDDGLYDFTIVQDPVYVIGNFQRVEEAETRTPLISTESLSVSAAAGDVAEFTFTRNTSKDLVITVDGLEVAENKGFVGNTAKVKVKTPNVEQNLTCTIRISDRDGRVYYCRNHEVVSGPPISVQLVSEKSDKLSSNRWRLKVSVKNATTQKALSGEVSILNPEEVASRNTTRKFANLLPGEEIVFFFITPERVSKGVFDAVALIELSDGYSTNITEQISFSQAVYAEKKPTIDGVNSLGEWKGSWIGANSDGDVLSFSKETFWEGPDDLSFNGNMMWDEENFYFLAAVNDDTHFTDHEPSGKTDLWRGDSVQLGFDDRESINTVFRNQFSELTIGYLKGVGNVVFKSKALHTQGGTEFIIEDAEIAIQRYDGYTVYECAIPWDAIFYEDYELKIDAPFHFSALVNDNDGAGRVFAIEYTSGIGSAKNAELFGPMTFEK